MTPNKNMTQHERYQEPLVGRYTDKDMQYIFSDEFKFRTWRRCWIALAESQMELGLSSVTKAQVDSLKTAATEEIDYERAREKEREIRHDVMAHVYEFGTHAEDAKGIIHLGATSMFVCCNTELIQIREALKLVKRDLINTIHNLAEVAERYKGLVTLGYTHYQPAQPTTIGKRVSLYIQDLLFDLHQIEAIESELCARGAKGTTGTQASFLELFDGDYEKVKMLDKKVSQKLGFKRSFRVTSQTYPRKFDTLVAKAIAGIGESAHKFAVDMRLMSNLKIMEEPFTKKQTGSSAMPYKRNPMRCERMTALSEKLMNLPIDFSHIHSNQWFERTLDDSSIRRMDIPQLFLLANAILKLYQNVTNGIVVHEAQVIRHLNQELPFMATEVILMELCRKGADRQEMHEIIKEHAVAAGNAIKEEGCENDFFNRLINDDRITLKKEFFDSIISNPKRFAGAARIQTSEYLKEYIKPVLDRYSDLIGESDSSINV